MDIFKGIDSLRTYFIKYRDLLNILSLLSIEICGYIFFIDLYSIKQRIDVINLQ
jgi:hypothetical protein